MTAAALPSSTMDAWRRRSAVIRVLRWALPALMGALVMLPLMLPSCCPQAGR